MKLKTGHVIAIIILILTIILVIIGIISLIPKEPREVKVDVFIKDDTTGFHTQGVNDVDVDTNPIIPFSFSGWKEWNNEITLSIGDNINEIIINGATLDATGFAHTTLNTNLRGRTLVLYFSNTRASQFSQNRMVKLVYNRNDKLLKPNNQHNLQFGEFLSNEDTPLNNGIEYLIPDDFDGKLNFVFYQAILSDLKITAYYK